MLARRHRQTAAAVTLKLGLGLLGFGLGLGLSATAARAADAKKGSATSGTNKIAQAGSLELALSGELSLLNKNSHSPSYIRTKLGYFAAQGLEAGINVLEGTTATGERNTFGAFVEYDRTGTTLVLPSLGLAFNHTNAPVDATNTKDARELSLYGGLSLALAPNIAVAALLEGTLADQAVLGTVGNRSTKQVATLLQMRLFF